MAQPHITFEGGGRTDFEVSAFTGWSAISRIYRYTIDLYCPEPNVDMAAMLTEPAWLGLRRRPQGGGGGGRNDPGEDPRRPLLRGTTGE